MTRSILAAAAALALAAPAAHAAPDRTGTVTDAEAFKATGTAAIGVNASYYDETVAPASCGKDAQNYCETTLVSLDPEVKKRALTFRLDGIQPQSDFDLRVYKSDATGKKGALVDTGEGDGNGPAGAVLPTFAGDFETVSVTNAKAGTHYLVEVVYFSVLNDTYDLTASLK